MSKKLGFVVGSLRSGSYTRLVADTVAKMVPAEYEVVFLETGNLPFFNDDLDVNNEVPETWKELRQVVPTLDGIIFFTPEYNRSIPANLKNMLDVGSRPYGQNVWNEKKALIVSQSPGAIGGFGAVQILRQSLNFLNVDAMEQPEVYLSHMESLIGEDGEIVDGTKGFLGSVLKQFLAFIEK